MVMPKREYYSSRYRYGFNGAEKDNEVKGDGNSYTTEWRQYDPRLGRWLSLDPAMAKYPSWSPYVFAFNNPIWLNDPDGDDPWKVEDIQKMARQSKIVTGLETKIKVTNWKVLRDESKTQTRTDNINKTIYLDGRSSSKSAVLGYVWELTNASNHDRDVKLRTDATNGTISKKDFVMGIFTMEAEAYINTALVSQDLKINDPNYSAFNSQIADYKAGKIKKADLVKQVAKYGYDNASINVKGKKIKLADEYGKQYDAHKKQGEDAKKNQTPAPTTTPPANGN